MDQHAEGSGELIEGAHIRQERSLEQNLEVEASGEQPTKTKRNILTLNDGSGDAPIHVSAF